MRTNNILILLFSIVFLMSFVFAAHLITTSSGGSSYSINESVITVFNISIQNTDSDASHNISVVNITIPDSFTFQIDSNGTNVTASNFVNTSTVLSWNKTAGLVPASGIVYFWFSATAATPGSYNITVETVNSSNSTIISATNISVTINDTSAPIAAFANPVEMYNSSSTNVTFSVSCSDNYNVSYIQLWGNWSGFWEVNQTNSSPYNDTAWNVSVLIPAGKYLWGVYCNDSATYVNNNNRTINRTLVIDTTPPVVKLVSPANNAESTATSQTFRFNVTDNFDTKNCSLYVDEDLEETYNDPDDGDPSISFDSVPLSGTSSGLSYDWYVNCTDYAGNVAKSSATWRITITDDSSDDAGSSSGSDAGFWTSTYSPSSSSFELGYVKELGAKARIKLTIGGSTHYVGLISLTSTAAKINVSSTPQQATFNIGDEKKFEVTGDSYYDILVKLNSIASNKANVSVKIINEKIPSLGGTQQNISGGTGQNETDSNSDDGILTSLPLGRLFWIVVVVSIAVVLISLGYYLVERRRKRFGY